MVYGEKHTCKMKTDTTDGTQMGEHPKQRGR
jgi:hypothetical protein